MAERSKTTNPEISETNTGDISNAKPAQTYQIPIYFRKDKFRLVILTLIFLILAIITECQIEGENYEVLGTLWVSFSSICFGWALQIWYQDVRRGDENDQKRREIIRDTESFIREQAKSWQKTLNALSLKGSSKELLEIVEYFWLDQQVMVRSYIEQKAQLMQTLNSSPANFINEMESNYKELRKHSINLGLTLVQSDSTLAKKFRKMAELIDKPID